MEAEKLIALGYDDPTTILKQMGIYRQAQYPENNGLIAGTVLLRKHNDPEVIRLMECWFDEVLQHSYRDQLSFNYSAWKEKFQPRYFQGQLDDNLIMKWPVYSGHRLPRGFRDDVYLALNPDVKAAKMNPRQHYITYGADEGRRWK